MSSKLDLVKSIYAAWERGDYGSAEWADPEIEFEVIGGPTPRRSKGLAGMSDAWREMLSAWEELRAVPEEYRELDDERVLVLLSNRGRGKARGIDVREISIESANVFTVRGGKVTKLLAYWYRDQALADLGL